MELSPEFKTLKVSRFSSFAKFNADIVSKVTTKADPSKGSISSAAAEIHIKLVCAYSAIRAMQRYHLELYRNINSAAAPNRLIHLFQPWMWYGLTPEQ